MAPDAEPGARDPFADLAYGVIELREQMQLHYQKIIDFISTPAFHDLMAEMSVLHHTERPRFVAEVLLNDAALAERGVHRPPGILIQRSAFGDRRPTLFAVKHFLPDGYRQIWENVNITFDNAYLDEVPRTRDQCWREPLRPDLQAEAMAQGQPLQTL